MGDKGFSNVEMSICMCTKLPKFAYQHCIQSYSVKWNHSARTTIKRFARIPKGKRVSQHTRRALHVKANIFWNGGVYLSNKPKGIYEKKIYMYTYTYVAHTQCSGTRYREMFISHTGRPADCWVLGNNPLGGLCAKCTCSFLLNFVCEDVADCHRGRVYVHWFCECCCR